MISAGTMLPSRTVYAEPRRRRGDATGASLTPSWAAVALPDWAVLLILCLMTFTALGKDFAVGGMHDLDSAAHAMDGVLVLDWISFGPAAWLDPMSFARTQYAHYPTLGMGGHYPPGFAVVEAGFFALFGVSSQTARLCVLCFGLAAAIGTYVFLRPLTDRMVAALAATFLMAFPETTIWGRQIMLEVPTLTVLIWAAVAVRAYFESPTWGRLSVVLVASLVGVLFKQSAVFFLGAFGSAAAFASWRGKVRRRHVAVIAVIATGLLLATFASLDTACVKTLSGYDSYEDPASLAALSFHLCGLVSQTGWLLAALAVFGLVVGVRLSPTLTVFLLAWMVISYVMVTVVGLKVVRFFYVGTFPVAIWAALGAGRILSWVGQGRLKAPLTALVVTACCVMAQTRSIEYGPDYGSIVESHKERIGGRLVLFSGMRDGDFVFAVRQHVPRQQTVVLRGSKLFYTSTARQDLDLVELVKTPEELVARMRTFAFDTVVLERENHVGTRQDEWLRTYLAGGEDYRLVASHPLSARVTDTDTGRVTIDVYELARAIPRTVDQYQIPIPRTKETIRVNLPPQAAALDGPRT